MAKRARPEAFDVVLQVMRDPQVEPATRLRAGELVLAYSDGKPRQSLELNIGAPRDISTLSTAELEAIAAGGTTPFAVQYLGQVIEGEAQPVEEPAATPARSAKAIRSGKASRSNERGRA